MASTRNHVAQMEAPAFVLKTFTIVEEEATNDIVSWCCETGDTSFAIWKSEAFEKEVLPRYFKHGNMCSFVRQLNSYGFHKVSIGRDEQVEFRHPNFQRGKEELLKQIVRKKSLKRANRSNETTDSTDTDASHNDTGGNMRLELEMKRLKTHNEQLSKEVAELRKQQEETNKELESIRQLKEKENMLMERLAEALNTSAVFHTRTSEERPSSDEDDEREKKRTRLETDCANTSASSTGSSADEPSGEVFDDSDILDTDILDGLTLEPNFLSDVLPVSATMASGQHQNDISPPSRKRRGKHGKDARSLYARRANQRLMSPSTVAKLLPEPGSIEYPATSTTTTTTLSDMPSGTGSPNDAFLPPLFASMNVHSSAGDPECDSGDASVTVPVVEGLQWSLETPSQISLNSDAKVEELMHNLTGTSLGGVHLAATGTVVTDPLAPAPPNSSLDAVKAFVGSVELPPLAEADHAPCVVSPQLDPTGTKEYVSPLASLSSPSIAASNSATTAASSSPSPSAVPLHTATCPISSSIDSPTITTAAVSVPPDHDDTRSGSGTSPPQCLSSPSSHPALQRNPTPTPTPTLTTLVLPEEAPGTEVSTQSTKSDPPSENSSPTRGTSTASTTITATTATTVTVSADTTANTTPADGIAAAPTTVANSAVIEPLQGNTTLPTAVTEDAKMPVALTTPPGCDLEVNHRNESECPIVVCEDIFDEKSIRAHDVAVSEVIRLIEIAPPASRTLESGLHECPRSPPFVST
eukprot:TRINITY_DN936_c0_g2_i1.p1 TRINITY_DN936_c0_g2~~TRINITY_DN936_c0_g2_i1.p1  ORF type:complete len:754 (+),score=154.86 TRINITY_DN936_c0_g2_i1:142-2403(+)